MKVYKPVVSYQCPGFYNDLHVKSTKIYQSKEGASKEFDELRKVARERGLGITNSFVEEIEVLP